MKFYLVVLLVAAALLPNADSTIPVSKFKRPATPTQVLEKIPTKRHLKAYTDDEGRGFSLSGLEQAIGKAIPTINLWTPKKIKHLQRLVRDDKNLGDAFNTLGLGKIKITEKADNFLRNKVSEVKITKNADDFIQPKMVATFFSSPNFKVWSQHAAKVSKEDPDAAMLAVLTNAFGKERLATMIMLGKDSSAVVKKLEAAQFNKWLTIDKFSADDALWNVMGVGRNKIHINSRAKYVWGDYSNYISAMTKPEHQRLFVADKSLVDAFKKMELSNFQIKQGSTIDEKLVAKLFSSSHFKVLFKDAAKLHKKNPEAEKLAVLSTTFGEKNAAKILFLGKDSVAKKLQKAQFEKWYAKDKLNADGVRKNVMDNKPIDKLEESVLWAYRKYYTKRVMDY